MSRECRECTNEITEYASTLDACERVSNLSSADENLFLNTSSADKNSSYYKRLDGSLNLLLALESAKQLTGVYELIYDVELRRVPNTNIQSQ